MSDSKIDRLRRRNGKEPIIEEQDVFRITIPHNPFPSESEADSSQKTTTKTTTKTTQRILNLLQENPMISINELASQMELTRDGMIYHINKLKKEGKIKHIGPNKGGHWEVINSEADTFK